MKNLIQNNFKKVFLLILSITLWSACSTDDNELNTATAPEIEFVAASVDTDGSPSDLTPTKVGFANNTYVIRGKGFSSLKHIYFNDHESYFNQTLVTDKNIIVTINEKTPYSNVSNKLKLVTGSGTVEFDFVVAPPAPLFNGFQSINTADGANIEIRGNYFVDPSVKVGDVQATIVSYDLTHIVATLPEGSQGKKVSITTISGTVVYDTTVGSAIFDDVFYQPYKLKDGNHEFVNNAELAYQGNVFIKKKLSGWGAFEGEWVWDQDAISKYTGIKFAVRSDQDAKMQFIFNGAWTDDTTRQFTTTKEWKEVKFTWAQLGNPAAVQNISFKEFTGNETTYYFDNITFTKD